MSKSHHGRTSSCRAGSPYGILLARNRKCPSMVGYLDYSLSPLINQMTYHAACTPRPGRTQDLLAAPFFDCATPVKLCSIVFCILQHIEPPAKLLDYYLRSNRSNINQCRLPSSPVLELDFTYHIKHPVNKLRVQVVNVRLCLLAISLTTCRLDNIV